MSLNKTCRQCQAQFAITDGDLAFYKKLSPTFDNKIFEIPAPTMCPDCRKQRRLAWRNIGKIYIRKSDLSGKQIVSCVAPNSKFKVYHQDEWMSDKFDPYQYGRDFDFSRPFFEQLHELSLDVPRPHMNVARNENSEYINNSSDCKSCYLIENATAAEDSLYSLGLFHSKDCIDCYKAFECENCYECINIEKSYGCLFCNDCLDCTESFLCDSCNGCKNCYGCANLSNKRYWVFNEPKSKEEFEKKKQEFLSASYNDRQKLIEEAENFSARQPKKFSHILSSENVSGDYIFHSKNVESSFAIDNSEDVKFSTNLGYAKDHLDVDFWGDKSELVYESAEVGTGTHDVLFSRKIHGNVRNVSYSIDCGYGCSNLFGCVGMKHAQYSIFNKKYSAEEYEKLAGKIIDHMQKTKEWGEFFPMSMSEFGYNETAAQEHFPLSKEGAGKLGAYWQDENYDQKFDGVSYKVVDIETYRNMEKAKELLESVIICKTSGRPFKIQPQELRFYLKNHLQIPNVHPSERYKARFAKINPQKTWHRKCMNEGCENEFETTYAPERKERVYCESCYQQSVI